MEPFIGREQYLDRLSGLLARVRERGTGCLLSVRGRRRVGKSRLLEEWLRREGVSHVFFAASRQAPEHELSLFAEEVMRSDLPAAPTATAGVRFDSWEAALTYVATLAASRPAFAGASSPAPGTEASGTHAQPVVVVLDEFPYLLEDNPALEGTVQKVWDRVLQRVPVLLVLVGSDVSMMAALTEYGRPLYGRALELVVTPFTPLEAADMLGLNSAAALDAYLVVGGFPLAVQAWRRGESLWRFLARELADPTSPLIVTGERILAAEFPREAQARAVLGVIGAGERTFTNISQAAGIPQMSLNRSLDILVRQKGVVAALQPLSSRPPKDTRYVVADPYLRFWLRFIRARVDEIDRGRGDLVVERIRDAWETYRGRAIEPLVREALERLLPDPRLGDARCVGGYWTRANDVEVDLVGARERTTPQRVAFVGSIKWKERAPFGRQDLFALSGQRARVPGADEDTRLVAVSRSGVDAAGLDAALGPDDLLRAWRPPSRATDQE
jgi:AAA+ ATPase superfamily predicted ATPase